MPNLDFYFKISIFLLLVLSQCLYPFTLLGSATSAR